MHKNEILSLDLAMVLEKKNKRRKNTKSFKQHFKAIFEMLMSFFCCL